MGIHFELRIKKEEGRREKVKLGIRVVLGKRKRKRKRVVLGGLEVFQEKTKTNMIR